MRIIVVALTMISLTSCGLMNTNTTPESTNTPSTVSVESTGTTEQKVTPSEVSNWTYVTLNYTLRDGTADGKVLETTLYSVATENGLTGKSETEYTPFSVMIGSNQLIVGFENGLIGLKKGDKKTIEVPPELGYGTGPVISTIPKYQIAPVFTITQDESVFADTIKETVSREQLPEDMKNATVGQVFTGAADATAKVIAADETSITLDIENTNNPFYGKSIAVGTVAETPTKDTTFKITAIKGTGVTLEVTNKNSPFYNKEFSVGGTLDLPTGKLEILEIKDEEVVVAQSHPMAGKTLFFDIEIIDIQ